MQKHPSKKTQLFLSLSKWTIGVLIGLVLFFTLLGKLSHYFYLKELGQISLIKPFVSQSLKDAMVSGVSLLFKYWRLLYQRRILIILALIISFPFVRRFVRRRMSHRVQKRPVLKTLYHLAPWIRVTILAWLIAHFILYDVAKQIGEKMAQENITQWNQYIEHCTNGETGYVQSLVLNKKTYRCAYIVAIHHQEVLFFDGKTLRIFNLKTEKETFISPLKK